ncbi:MAG: 3-deoxy-7-phosphoheptulonate synthase [Anaerolineae bacterium]
MIVEMQAGARQDQVDAVVARARSLSCDVQLNVGTNKVVVAILGPHTGQINTDLFAVLPAVASVTRIMRPFKLASREFRQDATTVRIGDLVIGGKAVVIMAGPCSIESHEQLLATAKHVRACGATILRGGAFKPRTSPFSFQGLGVDGIEVASQVREELGIPIVSEITEPHHLEDVADRVDLLQIGARNMQNYALLRAVGESKRPCILKRGLASTVTEWLQAADYILSAGNPNVILCERGIRTYETSTRFTLDISSVAVVKRDTHLPVIVDPSHAAGHFQLVPTLARAAVAAGADGLLIEVHPDPINALSDGLQSLTFSDFASLMQELKAIAGAIGREI